ncbi:putative G-protein coupled receptor [Halotydeus destructor]|nr:putative G-protein coupled receptor [Halotydeus destructor]
MSVQPCNVFLLVVGLSSLVAGQFQWQVRDSFDEVTKKMERVNPENCKIVNLNQLFLPTASVTHVPDIKSFGIDPIYPNRTNLLHIHNMAMSRAFFYSFILQKAADEHEPGFMYYFLSTIADVAANKYINASSIYYGPNKAFTPSYKGFFNKTMPLFAPRAYRADDFNDPYHLQGTSTLNTMEALDAGAIPLGSVSSNYTNDQYKINDWYKAWLPDTSKRHDDKTTYTAQITYANGTEETFVWHGPRDASDKEGPIKWNRPYYDCGRSNKWVYGASVPIPDIFPRHTGWRHIEIPLYVAVAVMEIDFDRIDINQCPISYGNPAPNYFAGTARCKNATTECEPIHGYGFRRGGYQCRCKAGFRLPNIVRTPYLGEMVERATESEYRAGYDCDKIGYIAVKTQNVQRVAQWEREMLMARIETLTGLVGNISTMHESRVLEPDWVIEYMREEVNTRTCDRISQILPDRLTLRGDIAFGKEEQLENQARMALRLANFISAFLQLVDPKEAFAEFRVPDKSLTEDQLIGEALATVIGDHRIYGCGILFDRGQFENKTLFAPYAYRKKKNDIKFFVDDLSRHHRREGNKFFLHKDYFKHLQLRWATNFDDLETFTSKINIRFNSSGLQNIRYDHYPLQYKAASLRHGYWTSPYFDCHGLHKDWIVNYAVPFFGHDKIQSRLEFKGVVVVAMKLHELDIKQCDDEPSAHNAFKNTHKCDRRSSRCVPILGRQFDSGGYKCECLQGYEYPYNDPITYFDGQLLESDYSNLKADKPSRFDTLKCRLSAANAFASPSIIMSFISFLIVAIFNYNNQSS